MSVKKKRYDRNKVRRDRYKRMIKRHYIEGHTTRECAEYAQCSIAYADKVIREWEIGENRATVPFYELPTFEPELNPSSFYDNHDEYSRHWAGAEKEDDRHEDLRGLDWPIRAKLKAS
jgi:hypothetical protein